MESKALPKARSERSPAEKATTIDGASDRTVIPFPVADVIGTPLRPMSAAQITSITRDPGMAEAMHRRLEHVEIKPETELRDAIWLLAGALMALISIAVMAVAAVAVATS